MSFTFKVFWQQMRIPSTVLLTYLSHYLTRDSLLKPKAIFPHSVLRCPVLLPPANGRLRSGACNNVHGSICHFQCNKGFKLKESVVRSCNKTSAANQVYWTGNATRCEGKRRYAFLLLFVAHIILQSWWENCSHFYLSFLYHSIIMSPIMAKNVLAIGAHVFEINYPRICVNPNQWTYLNLNWADCFPASLIP